MLRKGDFIESERFRLTQITYVN